MAILETLYILFKSDASEVKKTNEEVISSVKKTEDKLKSLGKEVDVVGQHFMQLAQSFAGAITAAVGVGTILGGVKHATQYAIELGLVSKQLGVNAAELDAWGNAVQSAGGTTEGFRSSLKSLSDHLGGSPKLALQVLPLLADTFQKLGRVRAFQYGKQLGLDESTILLLQQGRREVEATIAKQKELGVVSQQDTETFLKFNTQIINTGHAFRTLFTALALEAIPVLSDLLSGTVTFVQYLTKHKDVVVGALLAIGGAVVTLTAPILATYAAVTALIAAFGILFEDIKAFKEGKNSFIGDLTSKYGIKLFDSAEATRIAQENYERFQNLSFGQRLLETASGTPINSRSSSTIFNRNASVNTGPITVHTQATDARGMVNDLQKTVKELWQVNNYFADGVVA